jgi:hypothetical protein
MEKEKKVEEKGKIVKETQNGQMEKEKKELKKDGNKKKDQKK